MIRHAFAVSVARSRGGRALLHALCLARGRHWRWHLSGIVRELFGGDPRSGRGRGDGHPPAFPGVLLPWLMAAAHQIAMGASAGDLRDPGTRQAPGDASVPGVHLLTLAQVDGAGIHLTDLAAVNGLEPGAPPIRLAAAPRFGASAILTRDQVMALVRSVRPDLASARWSGADAIRVTRRSRVLAESELRDLLTATLQREVVKDRAELELRLGRPWTSVAVPDEPLLLKILDLPSAGVSAHFIVRFELVAGDDHLGPWQAVIQARLLKNVLVAASGARRGQVLEAGDVAVERRDLLTVRDPLDESALRGAPLEMIEMVSAGQPILARMVRLRPVVQRGMIVDGLMRDGSLNIALKVEVLADGVPGQLIRVRNPRTRREFYAKVKDEQTVLINL